MKLLFVITTLNHGKGGHFYDFVNMIGELKNSDDFELIEILNLGVRPSEVVKNLSVRQSNIFFRNRLDFFHVLKSIRRKVRKNSFDHIFCFDLISYFLTGFLIKNRITLVKCGGPNPIGYYPNLSNLIVMSKENYDFFNRNVKYKNSNISLIPNRVRKVKVDIERTNKLSRKISLKGSVFLKISRITSHYEHTLIQCINLHKELIKRNLEVSLLIIGVVEDNILLQKILKHSSGVNNVFYEHHSSFTQNASQLINIADFVHGTGRGVMEASSLGKIILTPLESEKLPVLISSNNFKQLFKTNFSPRNNLVGYQEKENLNEIIELVLKFQNRAKYESLSADYYKEYFDINKLTMKILEHVDNTLYGSRLSLYDKLRLFAFTFKRIFNARF